MFVRGSLLCQLKTASPPLEKRKGALSERPLLQRAGSSAPQAGNLSVQKHIAVEKGKKNPGNCQKLELIVFCSRLSEWFLFSGASVFHNFKVANAGTVYNTVSFNHP